VAKSEIFLPPESAIESSKWKRNGRSATVARMAANGIRGPSSARAKTKSTSSGLACAASVRLRVTSPLTAPTPAAGFPAGFAAAGLGADLACLADGRFERPGFLRTGFELCVQPRPVLGGGGELLSVACCGTGQQQRLRLVGVELEGSLDQLGRLALQLAVIAAAENIRVIGEQDRVLVDQRGGTAIGIGRFGKTFQHLVRTRQHDPALTVVRDFFGAFRRGR
jgi:hypothetical protein